MHLPVPGRLDSGSVPPSSLDEFVEDLGPPWDEEEQHLRRPDPDEPRFSDDLRR